MCRNLILSESYACVGSALATNVHRSDRLTSAAGNRQLRDKTNWATKANELAALWLARNGLQNQLSQLTDQPTYQVVSWSHSHPWIAGAGVLGLGLVSGYGGIFLLKPIWLLKLGDGQVKAIAWQCLKHTYRPTAAKKVDAIAALAAQGSEADGRSRLNYLEKRLRLLQRWRLPI